ncbi:hypothetical protein VSH64_15645 [Amycolatopsis rhabdoformis]|uniref:Uncharacterized protein n=1 Tax=Amycolatopsis rhabdoformis TaxID=1448059 RepID=A0ABZ1IGL0_9PSEU|nr:hypothetical protein [Amycolatopsis rhabdoformis]WSE33522.1 hypothetical protein VSH64_15645 [Amycolatopsis rhabdoformis]
MPTSRSTLPSLAVTEPPASLPPLAAVHALSADELDLLADVWEAHPSDAPTVLRRLGPAASRLRELRRAEKSARTCPVCAFDDLDAPPYLAFEGLARDTEQPVFTPPYSVHFGDPSRTRCPCCAYGFGLDDVPREGSEPVTFEAWFLAWAARGHPWHDRDRRPDGWDAATQLVATQLAATQLAAARPAVVER